MMIEPNNISYRDSVARVVKKESGYYRYIFHEYKTEYDHLMESGLYEELTEKELLIKHQEIELDTYDPKVYKLIYPTQLPFQSYPFEWSYKQWRKAILAYLRINIIALKYGMILKDATPYNFYLTGGKAVMFDTTSFIFFKRNDNWIAYRQFCEEFLSPVALMHYNGQRWSRLTSTHFRGLPLNFVSKQLPLNSCFNLNTLLHIHIHSTYANKKETTNNKTNAGFTIKKLNSLMEMMQSSLKRWTQPYQFEKNWSNYYSKDIDSEQYLIHKEEVITKWLNKIQPSSVLDLGANTGRFSMLAAKYTQKVIALESDDICVDIIEREIERVKSKVVNAILIDMVEASSNLGVLNKEYSSIYTRANSEMVMALAVVHHLHISDQLCFSQIAEMFSMFTSNYLIVEFIPITDSKVQFLIKDRKIDLSNYNQEYFIESLSKWFSIKEVIDLKDSRRSLCFLEKINNG